MYSNHLIDPNTNPEPHFLTQHIACTNMLSRLSKNRMQYVDDSTSACKPSPDHVCFHCLVAETFVVQPMQTAYTCSPTTTTTNKRFLPISFNDLLIRQHILTLMAGRFQPERCHRPEFDSSSSSGTVYPPASMLSNPSRI
jgi:hypothetical protein